MISGLCKTEQNHIGHSRHRPTCRPTRPCPKSHLFGVSIEVVELISSTSAVQSHVHIFCHVSMFVDLICIYIYVYLIYVYIIYIYGLLKPQLLRNSKYLYVGSA